MAKEKKVERIYFLGIKGVAMSGLAVMAKELGYSVAGSDEPEIYPNDKMLSEQNIPVFTNYSSENIIEFKPDIMVVGASYGKNNPELKYALKHKIKILAQSEMLSQFIEPMENIGVSGVHGKTTTTSLLTFIMKEAGFAPGWMIGTSSISGLATSSSLGGGKYFVLESDEYRKSQESTEPKFYDYPLKYLIVTSIELDHPDIYDSAESVYEVFYKLTAKIPRSGFIVACSDWPLVKRLVTRRADRECLTYGFKLGATYQIIDFKEGEKTTFTLKNENVNETFETNLPGAYNAQNAAAAIIMAENLGIPYESIRRALLKFTGPSRRFEKLGHFKNTLVIDDFAHHPTAVAGVIEAAKNIFPNKNVVVVFQPHTYSRTGKFLKEFAESLSSADKVILLNIFASAREKSGYITINDLYKEVKKIKNDVEFRPSLEETALYLANSLSSDDVLLLIGAGNVYKIYSKLKEIEADSQKS